MKLIRTSFWPEDEARGVLIYEYPGGLRSGPFAKVVVYRSALPKSSIWHEIFRKPVTGNDIEVDKILPVRLQDGGHPVGLLRLQRVLSWSNEGDLFSGNVLHSIITMGDWRLSILIIDSAEDEDFPNARHAFNEFVQKIGGLPQEASDFVSEEVPVCREPLHFVEAKPVDLEVSGDALLRNIAPKILARSRPQCRQDLKGQDFRSAEHLFYHWDDEMGGYSRQFEYDEFAIHFVKVNFDREDGPYAKIFVTPNAVYLMKFYDRLPDPEDVEWAKLISLSHHHRVWGALGSFSRVPINSEASLR